MSMKIPAECMSGLTDPVGLHWFHSISRAAENYPGFPPPQGSRANAFLEAELLGLTSIP